MTSEQQVEFEKAYIELLESMKAHPQYVEVQKRWAEHIEFLESLKAQRPAVPDVDLVAWVDRLTKKYPQVQSVHLCGSRARGLQSHGSDYDLCLCLEDGAYELIDGHVQQKNQIEQVISFDPEICFKGLDLFFLRPRSTLHRWMWGPGGPSLEEILEEQARLDAELGQEHCEWWEDCVRDGSPIGDFDRWWRDSEYAKELSKR
jgi:predicted nucleotidyltransferase